MYGHYGHEECRECSHYKSEVRGLERDLAELKNHIRDAEWDHDREMGDLRYEHAREIARLNAEWQDTVYSADRDREDELDELHEQIKQLELRLLTWPEVLDTMISAAETYIQYGERANVLDLARAEVHAYRSARKIAQEKQDEINQLLLEMAARMADVAAEQHAQSPFAEALRQRVTPGEFMHAHGNDFEGD